MTLSPLSALIHHSQNMPSTFPCFITADLYPGLFVPLCLLLSEFSRLVVLPDLRKKPFVFIKLSEIFPR